MVVNLIYAENDFLSKLMRNMFHFYEYCVTMQNKKKKITLKYVHNCLYA